MGDVILCNISDANKVIEEARFEWVHNVLLNLGVPEDIFEIKEIRDFRYEISNNFGIEVELKANKEVDIYKKQWNNNPDEELQGWLPVKKEHLVAQWKEPKRVRKVEGKDVYYEIHINEWSFTNVRR